MAQIVELRVKFNFIQPCFVIVENSWELINMIIIYNNNNNNSNNDNNIKLQVCYFIRV